MHISGWALFFQAGPDRTREVGCKRSVAHKSITHKTAGEKSARSILLAGCEEEVREEVEGDQGIKGEPSGSGCKVLSV
jgi:hypothetical protein